MAEILKLKQNGAWVGVPAIKGEKGDPGEGVPSGGTTGQVLSKSSDTSYDVTWATINALPDQSGKNGKFLTTNGSAASWGDIPNVLTPGTHISINNNVISTDAKNVSVSSTGSSTTDVQYITIDNAEYRLAGGSQGGVQSVNGQTGVVVLDAEDVGALPDTTAIPSKTSDLTNDSGFITNSALNGYATKTWVGQQGYLTEHQSLANYDTKSEVNSKISAATSDMATKTWVEGKGYLTQHQSLAAYRTSSAQDTIDDAMASDISAIEGKIPGAATSSNQLADKDFVNSSITTNTATFRGTSAAGLTEEQFLAWANGLTKTNNDYVFWNTVDADGNTLFKRYKYNGTSWIYEYTLNNSSFTAAQWSAINSGITSGDVTLIGTALQPSAIADMASKTWVGQQGYLTEHQSLANYSTTSEMNTAIANHHDSTKQDNLPSVVNDRYLHTNASTGALEWSQVDISSKVDKNANSTVDFSLGYDSNGLYVMTGPEIVSWATGTDAQILAMVEADRDGIIDLRDYWSVGDTRSVSLSAMEAGYNLDDIHAAQAVEFVLMDNICTGFTWVSAPTSGATVPRFIVGMKNSLNEAGAMNNSTGTNQGWSNCRRRYWCNDVFNQSIPSSLRGIFKQFSWKQGTGDGRTSGLNTTTDTFGLPPEKCVLGSATYSQNDEANEYSQWLWYQTANNRIKTLNGSDYAWWECSTRASSSSHYGSINKLGNAGAGFANNSVGLSMFGCI